MVLADEVPPDLVTIASRCVRIDVCPIPDTAIVERLVSEGITLQAAQGAARAAAGDLRRARVLATDPAVATRHACWHETPSFLDGTGLAATTRTGELMMLIDQAAGPLQDRHRAEIAELQARIDQYGERGSGRKQTEDQHKRELRRHRMDELRFGLATLARCYRDRLVEEPRSDYTRALERIQHMAAGLVRNPNEKLQLQALLFALPPLPPDR